MKSVTEWSTQFDLYWNNIASDKAPGLEEYEKSVFLTDAQDSIVVALYKGQLGKGFEVTEELKDYLDTLVKQVTVTNPAPSSFPRMLSDKYHSVVFETPGDLLFRTWEACTINPGCGNVTAEVIPVTQDDFWRTIRNPFRRPNNRRVLRLSYSTNTSGGDSGYDRTQYSELVYAGSNGPSSYTVRYLAYPDPIILGGCSETGLKIRGQWTPQTCKLPESIHSLILAEAVRLAKAAWNI